jgi:ribosomal subunit interface protein
MDVEIDKTITVGGSNIELGSALVERARSGLAKIAARYFGRITQAAVHFTRDGINYRCTVNMHPGGLALMSAEAQHKDPYVALNLATGRLAKQLRRSKRALHDDKPTAYKGMDEVSRRRRS